MEKAKSGRNRMFILVSLLIGLVVGAGITYAFLSLAQTSSTPTGITTYEIGGALELTGDLATWGVQGQGAAHMAIDEMNALLNSTTSNIRFDLKVSDTKSVPDECLKVVQFFHSTYGINMVVGPYTSSEVSAIKSYSDANNIVICAISTSPTLSLPDYVFRFMAPDQLEAKGYARLAWNLGYRKVAIIYRNDAWGVSLENLFEENFKGYGGTVDKVQYAIGQSDYATEVASLSSLVQNLEVSNNTAVLYLTFETDGVNILGHALQDSTLTQVRWFLSDSILTDALYPPKGSKALADYLIQTNTYGLRITGYTSAITSTYMNNYAKYGGPGTGEKGAWIYDATWIAMLSILTAGTTNGAAVAKVIPKVASVYDGATGPEAIDANGDRLAQTYHVYKIAYNGTAYNFVDTGGSYDSATDILILPH